MKKVLKSVFMMTVLALVTLFATKVQAVDNSIADVAAADGRFTTLLGAAEAAGLDAMLENNGPFTVFAPTDDAFAALGADTIASLSETQLRQVLLYHIVQGSVKAEDVVGLTSATTALGQDVGISVADGTVVLTGATSANVIITDIEAANGVIHVIDAVLIPPSLAPTDMSAGGDADAGDGDMGDTPAPAGDGADLLGAVNALRGHVQSITGNLDGSNQGQNIDCATFIRDYEAIQALPSFENISADLTGARDAYVAQVKAALAAGEGIYASCTDGDGKIGSLDWGIARQSYGGIDGAIGGVQEALIAIYGEDAVVPADGAGDDAGDEADAGDTPAPSGEGVEFLGAVRTLREAINSMVYIMDNSGQGQNIDCATFLANYETIRTLPSYEGISAEFAGLRDAYGANRDAALAAAEGVKNSCADGDGTVGALDASVTRTALSDIGNALGTVEEGIVAITGEVDTTAPDPVEPPADEAPPAEEEMPPADGGDELTPEEILEICLTSYTIRGLDAIENGDLAYDEVEFVCDFIVVEAVILTLDFYLEEVNAGNADGCVAFVDVLPLLAIAPTYFDIPADVQPIYNGFHANLDAIFVSTVDVFDACEDGRAITSAEYDSAKAGLAAGLSQLYVLLDQFAPILEAGSNGLTITELRMIKAFKSDISSSINAVTLQAVGNR